MKKDLNSNGYLRLADVIGPDGLLPIGRSNWYQRIADKRAPPPVKCGRLSMWRVSQVERLLENPDAYVAGEEDTK